MRVWLWLWLDPMAVCRFCRFFGLCCRLLTFSVADVLVRCSAGVTYDFARGRHFILIILHDIKLKKKIYINIFSRVTG